MLPPQLIRSALESAPDAIVICDAPGVIVFANRQATALFGYDSAEITGMPVELLLPARFRTSHLAHRAAYARAPCMRPMGQGQELRGRHKDGREFPVEISLSPVRDGERMLVAAAVRDVTERKRIEVELLAAREAADRANLAKSRFLATASHDLRQPLQALALLNGALRRLPAAPHVSQAVAEQEQAIAAMSRLVNALLDISKLESGAIKPEITDFEVAALFAELRREFASLAHTKGLDLQVECCKDSVRSDPSLVEQILRNLVSNAIKYTQRGRVLLRCLHEPSLVRVEVQDTGIGIPADQMPYIFDEFFQVGVAPNTSRDGYGLGLSIVSRLVKLLELKLDVHSEPGGGSRFSLTLPASKARTASGSRGLLQDARPRFLALPRRVLLVEDDEGVLRATRLLLEAEGYEVATASSVADALEKTERIDLLITDLHLGGGRTGTELIGLVRERIGIDLPVILLTGDTSAAVQSLQHDKRWRTASKPLQADQLLVLIDELLRH